MIIDDISWNLSLMHTFITISSDECSVRVGFNLQSNLDFYSVSQIVPVYVMSHHQVLCILKGGGIDC